MYTLRPYQTRAVDSVFDYFERKKGNPLIVLPTAAGKSIVQADFIRQAIEQWPATRVMCITHVKELLEQNHEKLEALLPGVKVGIYSSGLGLRDTETQVIVGGIQSCYKNAHIFGRIHLVFIDEAHLVPKSSASMYRSFLVELKKYNQYLKAIGMTATPYRTKGGLLHRGEDRLFTDICCDVSIRELISDRYICKVKTISSKNKIDTTGLKSQGGDYRSGDLEERANDDTLTAKALDEVMEHCPDRKSWLIFCCGIDHAEAVTLALEQRGVSCGVVHGMTPKAEREETLRKFKAGEIRALSNMNVLTTGFDAPNIDALIMLRPTQSPGLYVQMVGRGFRLHEGKEDTLVMDFSGNIIRHGPVDQIEIRESYLSSEEGVKTAPQKECPKCQALCFVSVRECPNCGHPFEMDTSLKHDAKASDANILSGGESPITEHYITDMVFKRHQKEGKPDSLKVSYSNAFLKVLDEWICFEHGGRATSKARLWWSKMAGNDCPETVTEALERQDEITVPKVIRITKDGKFNRLVDVKFN